MTFLHCALSVYMNNCILFITAPKGHDVAVTYKKENNGMQRIEFVPQEVGMHTINVTYSGAHIGDSPYQVMTYDPKLVHFSKMPLGILNIPFKFRVLAEEAGDGKIEVTVESDGEKIPIELVALSKGTFEVTFMGNGEKVHTLSILFNGEHIPKSPIFINFADIDKIKIQKPNNLLVACDRLVSLQMTSAPTAIDDIVCNIEGPVYNSVPFKIRNVADRLYSIDWMPVKPGNYDVDVKFGNVIPAWGSPLKIKAYDSTKVKVIQSGCEPIVGERHLMKFDVSDAGEGELVVIIMCAGETVQSSVNKGQDDLVWVSFEPQAADLYDVYATFNKEPIPGSPFKIDLSVDEPDCQDLALMNTKYFIVQDLQWCFLQTIGYMLPYEQIVMSITGCCRIYVA